MLKTIVFSIILVSILACDKKSKFEKIVQDIPIELAVARFDQAFFTAKPTDLPKLKKDFPAFFPKSVSDDVWLEKISNPQWQELYIEVQKKYKNFEPQTTSIAAMLQHIKYYFPQTKTPKITTLIYEMDFNTKAIYADSIILIPLEMYLGKTHKFYEFPDYQKQTLEPSQILPDIVSSFAQSKIKPLKTKNLLSLMIQSGKELYLKDLLLPEISDANKIGYTPQQIAFCQENEPFMWAYFIEKNLLYSSDSKLDSRFIKPAPFSKFYLDIDNDTPGRIGQWVGWQIVRAYAENNPKVGIKQLLDTDAETIFNQSKYKPKK
jgi:gliding motility-associated lipoprotein GldB